RLCVLPRARRAEPSCSGTRIRQEESDMSSRRRRGVINLPAPYLRRLWLDPSRIADRETYPFCLPLFRGDEFALDFEHAVTIVVGENGTGKSTLLEGIAALAGYDEAGRGNGYRPVD